MLGAWLGSLYGLDLSTYDGNTLRFWYGKPVVTTLGALYGFPLGTYEVIELGSLEDSTEGTADYDPDCMLIGYWQHFEIWMGSHFVHMVV